MNERNNMTNVSKAITSEATSTTEVTSARTRPKSRIIQNHSVIWLDCNIDLNKEDYQHTLTQLGNVVLEVNTCTNLDQCVEFLNNVNDGKAFVIVSGMIDQQVVPKIHDMPNLDTIYIFCNNEMPYQQWTTHWPKIEGVFTSIEPICESLRKVTRVYDRNAVTMSFVPQRVMMYPTVPNQPQRDQLGPSFMYTSIFKEIILEIEEDDTKSVKVLVDYCRDQGISESELIYFQCEYKKKTPIWWYTQESFLYWKLNQGLRTLDMEVMMKMGFFIRSLHQQLTQLYKKQADAFVNKFIVYRGQRLLQEDFDRLHDTVGGLLAFNNFLSASKEKRVAMNFVRHAMNNSQDVIGVVFIMTIDPTQISTKTTAFAPTDDYSAIPSEQEILFTMHTIFRVGDMKQMSNNSRLWEVQLTITDDNDSQLTALTNRIKQDLKGCTGWHRMGKLMLQAGHFNQAEELYYELLRNTTSDSDRAHIYHQLGLLKNKQGKYKDALIFYEKSLEIKLKQLPDDDPSLAILYNNIGEVCNTVGDYSKALQFYENSLRIKEKTLPSNHPSLAISYNNIGLVYDNMNNYSKALEFYEKSIQIKEKVLPPNHPSLATSYNNVAGIYKNTGSYSKALEFYMKSHTIFEKALPSYHPDLASSFNNVGLVYYNMNNYSKALEFFEKDVEITEKALPPHHPDLATSYNSIGLVHDKIGNYSKALDFYEKSLKIREKSLPSNHPAIASSYNNIGVIYKNVGDYSKALEFHKKSLKIKENTLSPNHSDLAVSYNNIGTVYYGMTEYSKALEYLDKAVSIWQTTLPVTHINITTVLTTIALLRKKLQNVSFPLIIQ